RHTRGEEHRMAQPRSPSDDAGHDRPFEEVRAAHERWQRETARDEAIDRYSEAVANARKKYPELTMTLIDLARKAYEAGIRWERDRHRAALERVVARIHALARALEEEDAAA